MDKWGPLLSRAEAEPGFGLAEAEASELDPETPVPFFDAGRIQLVPYHVVRARQTELYAEVLGRHIDGASALVELGAGYGSKILRLSAVDRFSALPLHAAELAPSGQQLITLLAERAQRRVAVGACDFREATLTGMSVPENAIIYTSFAAHYVPELTERFVDWLAAFRPRVVVHFEPCLEHMGSESLHDLLCRAYILRNDYNRNLVGVLRAAERAGTARIVDERRKVMGANPLFPLSVLAWRPS